MPDCTICGGQAMPGRRVCKECHEAIEQRRREYMAESVKRIRKLELRARGVTGDNAASC